MTSDEVKKSWATDLSTNGWLREIALQLALLNEKKPEVPLVEPKPANAPKKGK